MRTAKPWSREVACSDFLSRELNIPRRVRRDKETRARILRNVVPDDVAQVMDDLERNADQELRPFIRQIFVGIDNSVIPDASAIATGERSRIVRISRALYFVCRAYGLVFLDFIGQFPAYAR